MDTLESLGYLKGLLDGLELDGSKKETKIFKAIVDVLDDLSKDVDDVYEEIDTINESIDDIDEGLGDIEDIVYGCEGCEGCEYFEEPRENEDQQYELTCPLCGADIVIDANADLENGVQCPSCGEMLQLEPDDDNNN